MKSAEGHIPGMAPEQPETAKPKVTSATPGLSKSAKKNLKRKEKKQQEYPNAFVDNVTSSMAKTSLDTKSAQSQGSKGKADQSQASKGNSQSQASAQPKAEPDKRLKNLKKKLRQIEDLEAKLKSGEIKELQKEQKDKIDRKDEILQEIEDIELELADVWTMKTCCITKLVWKESVYIFNVFENQIC